MFAKSRRSSSVEARVYGFAFQREDAEDAFVDAAVARSRVAYVSGVPNDRDLFAYASSAPTALAVVGTVVRDGVSVSELRYDDGAHGTVSALIAEPAVGARPVRRR